jgi:hypothetical protein
MFQTCSAPPLLERAILHRDHAVLRPRHGDVTGPEPIEVSPDVLVVELAASRVEREQRVLDQRTVRCVGQHVEERRTVVLIGVEVHQRDDLRVEHGTLRPHLPATEVLPQRMTHDLVASPTERGGRSGRRPGRAAHPRED